MKPAAVREGLDPPESNESGGIMNNLHKLKEQTNDKRWHLGYNKKLERDF